MIAANFVNLWSKSFKIGRTMKKSLYLIFVALVAIVSVAAQAQVKFCGVEITEGKNYTKSDFPQIKSGSFHLTSNGSQLVMNDLVAESNTILFKFDGTNTVYINFKGENRFTTTANVSGAFVFSGPENGYRNIIILGDKAYFINTYGAGGAAFAYGKNCNVSIDNCYLHTTATDRYNDYYSVVKDINQLVSTTSRVTIENATVIGCTFFVNELILKSCNFATPRSSVKLDVYDSYGRMRLRTKGEDVKGFVILPDDQLLDGDVNCDGKVNVSDVTHLVNLILGVIK